MSISLTTPPSGLGGKHTIAQRFRGGKAGKETSWISQPSSAHVLCFDWLARRADPRSPNFDQWPPVLQRVIRVLGRMRSDVWLQAYPS